MQNLIAARRVLWGVLFLKIGATTAMLLVGVLTSSLALIASGINASFDAIAAIVGIVGVHIAAQPPDEEHPYGYTKAEAIATLAISVLFFITAYEVGRSAVERILDPSLIQTTVNIYSFGAMLISLFFNTIILLYALPQGRRLRSQVLIATAMDTRIDVVIAISVMLALLGVRAGVPLIDPAIALALAVLIARTGYVIISNSFPPLMDQAALSADQVRTIALSVPGVRSVHQVRSRGAESAVYADLHIRVDPSMDTEHAHAIAHEVQARLREGRPDIQDVTIHVEPQGRPDEPPPPDLVAHIRRLAADMDVELDDVWVQTLGGQHYLELHMEADGDKTLSDAHALASQLETKIRADISDLAEVTTHIEPSVKVDEGALEAEVEASPEAKHKLAETICRAVNDALGGDTCHHVQLFQRGERWDVSFHCRLPGNLSLAEAHERTTALEGEVRAKVPSLERIVIHTEPFRSE